MYQKQDFIAVFDSGVGGISVLRQLYALMPNERYLYFGDSAHAPYGSRSTQEIQQLALHTAGYLLERNIKALVVACNTATAAAIDLLRSTYPELIVVGIEPALKPAAKAFPGKTVGVLATPVTLREEKFRHLVALCQDQCQVVDLAAPGLSDLIEAGKANSPETEALLRSLLDPWKNKLSALVLGCTHYPFASETIQKVAGSQVALFDGGAGTAAETRRRLAQADLLYNGPGCILWENSTQDPQLLALSKALFYENSAREETACE